MTATAEDRPTTDLEGRRLHERLPLAQAAAELPRRRRGRKTATQTLYRWTGKGCRGVRLQYVQIGATRCTTRAWLAEFFDKLTQASAGSSFATTDAAPSNQAAVRSPGARLRAVARADKELAALGV